MSDSNRVASRWVLETTPGTTPDNPVFQNVCHTGAGQSSNPDYKQSEKICGGASRGVKSNDLFGFDPTSTLPMEFALYEADLLIPGVFQNPWNVRNRRANTACIDPWSRPSSNQITDVDAGTDTYTVASGIAFAQNDLVLAIGFTNPANNGLIVAQSGSNATNLVAPDGTADEASPPTTAMLINVGVQGTSGDIQATTSSGNALTSSSLNFTTLGLTAGQWVKVGGADAVTQLDTSGINDWVRVSAVAENRLDLDVVPSAWATNTGTGKTVQLLFGDYVTDGVTVYTYTHEIHDTGIGVYRYQTGVQPNTLAIDGRDRNYATARIDLESRDIVLPATSRISGATTIAEAGRDAIRSGSTVQRLAVNGAELDGNDALNFSLSITNNLAPRNSYDQDGRSSLRSGDFVVSGNINTYWESKALLDYALGGTGVSFDVFHREPLVAGNVSRG
ncbi:MAG: phage tail tube protein, partial [Planctomycetota bacterium]